MLQELFAIIAPVLLTAALGYGWIKSGREFDTKRMTALITAFGTPALVLSTLLEADLTPEALGQTMLYAAIATVAALSLGWLGLRLTRQPVRPFLPALSFPNCGNLGLPICLFAFGETGLGLAIAYFAVVSTTQFTVGYAVAAGELSIGRAVRTPLLWSVALAILLIWLDIDAPLWIMNTIGLVGDMTIPLMLFALGVSLARLPVGRLARPLILSIARLAGGFAIGLAVVTLFELDGILRGVILVQTAMPVAVFNYLFAELHDNAPEEVAGMVVVSSVVGFVTMPFLLAFALS